MYYDILRTAWKNEPSQRQVLIYILEHTNLDTMEFIRSNSQIQKDLCLSQPTVTKAMKRIEEIGAITKLPFHGWKVNVPMKRPEPGDDIENNVLITNYGL